MSRKTLLGFVLLGLLLVVGCKVTASLFLEKDWQTEDVYNKPDLRTKFQISAERNFENWDDVILHQRGGEK